MRPSRGMGAVMPDKMPKGKKKARRDNTDFTEYKEGGIVKKKKDVMLDKLQRAPISKMLGKKEGGPVGLYANINARKKQGTSRPKSKSTVTPEAYANMKAGFPKGKK